MGSIPGSGRSPGGGHDNPLQYSCLENPMDRGAWWATVHGVAKNQTPTPSIRAQRSPQAGGTALTHFPPGWVTVDWIFASVPVFRSDT